jgi:hypothetical protein
LKIVTVHVIIKLRNMETWPDVYDKDLVYRTMHINKINEKVSFGLDTYRHTAKDQ